MWKTRNVFWIRFAPTGAAPLEKTSKPIPDDHEGYVRESDPLTLSSSIYHGTARGFH